MKENTKKENLIADIRGDFSRFKIEGSNVKKIMGLLVHPGLRFTLALRILRFYRIECGYLYMTIPLVLLYLFLREFSGIQISYGMTIGPSLYIPHPGGIVVNQDTIIGKSCYLSHNVTVGRVHAGVKKGVPVIGDNVYIGPGAVILGNCSIGDNAAIAANSVVIEDVPCGCFVGGIPARVLSRKSADEILGYA